MHIRNDDEPGQNKMWGIYPLEGDMENSIRVNQLVDVTQYPPIYRAPRIEISAFWLHTEGQLRAFRAALAQAELQAVEWMANTGKVA